MGTVIQDVPHINQGSQPRWERCERADLFAQYRAWRTQGVAERQAAKELTGPRTTLQAWRVWPDTLARCPHVADFLQSGPGLAFLHRIVMALHLVCVAVGACGMRLVCLVLHLPGLHRCVAASYGAQQQVHLQVDQAMVTSHHDDTTRLANDMPPKDLTVPQDETCTGGLCLLTLAPESHCILWEQLAQARDPTTWDDLMVPALAPRNGRVSQATSDAAPGLLASVEHALAAHHAPDLFHGQPELVTAVSGPMATKERAAPKAVSEAKEQLARVPPHPQSAGDEPQKCGPGRPPHELVHLEHAEQVLEAARREHERLAQQRAQVAKSLRGIGHAYHCVDLERGVRRNGSLIASDIQGPIEQMRTLAQHAGLSQRCVERIENAERVVPKMQAPIACGAGEVRPQGDQLDLTPPASFARPAKLIPSDDLERVAHTGTVSEGVPLRALAERLRAPLFAPGGVFSALRPEAQGQFHDEAKRLAAVCQRSRANVEGRNGYVALRNHQRRGLDLPRKRECFTAMHHFFLTRPDGTTAAERCFGQKPRAMFGAMLASVALAPAPLRPPRRA